MHVIFATYLKNVTTDRRINKSTDINWTAKFCILRTHSIEQSVISNTWHRKLFAEHVGGGQRGIRRSGGVAEGSSVRTMMNTFWRLYGVSVILSKKT